MGLNQKRVGYLNNAHLIEFVLTHPSLFLLTIEANQYHHTHRSYPVADYTKYICWYYMILFDEFLRYHKHSAIFSLN